MVTVDFQHTEEHFVQSFVRYRSSGRKRWSGVLLRLLGGATCVYFGYHSWRDGQTFPLGFFVFAILFFGFFGHFMNVIARAQFRRSPYRDEEVRMEFSEDGVEIKSPTTDVQCRWSAFTSATEFADGLLLFRGPLFHWIPAPVVTSDGGIEELRELVRSKVSDYTVRSPLVI